MKTSKDVGVDSSTTVRFDPITGEKLDSLTVSPEVIGKEVPPHFDSERNPILPGHTD